MFTNTRSVKPGLTRVALKAALLLVAMTAAQASFAWEAYEFEVSTIRAIHGSSSPCIIGMKNLGPKTANDAAICDNPSAVYIANCTTVQAQTWMALALAAKTSGRRLYHQAISEHTASPCQVNAYSLTLVDD